MWGSIKLIKSIIIKWYNKHVMSSKLNRIWMQKWFTISNKEYELFFPTFIIMYILRKSQTHHTQKNPVLCEPKARNKKMWIQCFYVSPSSINCNNCVTLTHPHPPTAPTPHHNYIHVSHFSPLSSFHRILPYTNISF